MHIGVVGINHKLASLKLREALARICQRRFGAGRAMHISMAFVLLSTCNRTEIYFSADNLTEAHSYILEILRREVHESFDQKLYSYFSEDCFLHLARVTTGMDSAIVAETEIQGQVKNAYLSATSFAPLPYELHYLFQKTLKIGKEMRNRYAVSRGMPDIEHAVYSTGCRFFSAPNQAKILFVGVSEINIKILRFFLTKQCYKIAVCNRTREKAQKMALTHSVNWYPWESLRTWDEFDWLIFGTKSPEPLISETVSTNRQRLIIDLSFPRNVHPKVGSAPHTTLLNLDQVMRPLKIRRKKLLAVLEEVEGSICEATKQQIALFKNRRDIREHLLAQAS